MRNITTPISKGIQIADMVQQLQAKGITEDKNGTSIHELGFYQLQHELSLSEMKGA